MTPLAWLRDASLDRLACLLRSDHPFGAYYRWCALLCAFGEAALDHGLLSPSQLEPIRHDIEASLPGE